MTDYRVTVENGTVAEYPTAYTAVLALLAELENDQLQRLKLSGIHAEQMRRTDNLPPAGEVGAKAVRGKPYVTDV